MLNEEVSVTRRRRRVWSPVGTPYSKVARLAMIDGERAEARGEARSRNMARAEFSRAERAADALAGRARRPSGTL
jgi:hypothetical protein